VSAIANAVSRLRVAREGVKHSSAVPVAAHALGASVLKAGSVLARTASALKAEHAHAMAVPVRQTRPGRLPAAVARLSKGSPFRQQELLPEMAAWSV